MTTKRLHGRDFNFFSKQAVSTNIFPVDCQVNINMPIAVLTFQNEGTTTSHVVEYSFNGTTVHGDLTPTKYSANLTFEGRAVTTIWFRVASGSTGPITIRIEAWAPK